MQRRAAARYRAKDTGNIIAVIVDVPDRVLIGAAILPGNLIAGCRLLRADRRPSAELSQRVIGATIFQRGTRARAVKKEIRGANLGQAGRASRFDHRRGYTNHPVAVQILVEA